MSLFFGMMTWSWSASRVTTFMSTLFVETTFMKVGESWRASWVAEICVVVKLGMYECYLATESRLGKK